MAQESQPEKKTQNAPPKEQFGIQSIYVKDISFETPNSPQIFKVQWQPEIELKISDELKTLQEDVYEVTLTLTATVKVKEKQQTAFLIEVHQAGVFTIKGFPKDKLSYMIHSYCPNLLFPYARELISSLVARGGFQPLLLAPINFDTLYTQRLKQQQNKQAS
ncbi:MAG: protein-export chaperone SecB [Thiomargarita sp.]|nr:protein-export chaperone SecB [Thiomargarita sp.]